MHPLPPEQPLQPDQDTSRWDGHAGVYEAVFEGLTDAFAARALDLLEPLTGKRLLDLAAGTGGAAILAAARGAHVCAFDGSEAMVTRIRARAGTASIIAEQVDARRTLPRADGSFDAALSCLGVVLLPDPVPALRELARVLRPGGQLAVVTWTEPGRYELAARLLAAVGKVRGAPPPPPPTLPAQLRYADPDAFVALLQEGGFAVRTVERVEAFLHASSARALAGTLDFAPGMGALMASLGPDRGAVEREFAAALEAEQGLGQVALEAIAHIAVAAPHFVRAGA